MNHYIDISHAEVEQAKSHWIAWTTYTTSRCRNTDWRYTKQTKYNKTKIKMEKLKNKEATTLFLTKNGEINYNIIIIILFFYN